MTKQQVQTISLVAFVTLSVTPLAAQPGTQTVLQTNWQAGIPTLVQARISAGGEDFRIVRLAEGLEYPWALAFLPDGGLLISERPGRLLLLSSDGSRQEIRGLPAVSSSGQGGLLDLALHPDFQQNRLVYWTYAAPGPGGASTALARGRLDGNSLRDVRVLWTMQKRSGTRVHFGSRIRFGADGKIYMTTGERGDQSRARDPADSAGKVIRLNDDGTIPPDNPFAGRRGYLPELYSLGHRNAQGLAFRPALNSSPGSGSGQLWLTEHGPKGGDEVNIVKPGADYGWPLTTYGVAYSGARIAEFPTAPGIEPPVLHWTPSIAPSGLEFYTGIAFPSWRGDLLAGSLIGQKLVRIRLSGDGVTGQDILLDGQLGRIRDVRVGPDGLVYLLTDERNGGLFRLEPLPGI
jgi:glucose/arabinose dehydrogenase